jgi:hypothetical protein
VAHKGIIPIWSQKLQLQAEMLIPTEGSGPRFVPNDTKVSIDTFVQWIHFNASGLIATVRRAE